MVRRGAGEITCSAGGSLTSSHLDRGRAEDTKPKWARCSPRSPSIGFDSWRRSGWCCRSSEHVGRASDLRTRSDTWRVAEVGETQIELEGVGTAQGGHHADATPEAGTCRSGRARHRKPVDSRARGCQTPDRDRQTLMRSPPAVLLRRSLHLSKTSPNHFDHDRCLRPPRRSLVHSSRRFPQLFCLPLVLLLSSATHPAPTQLPPSLCPTVPTPETVRSDHPSI